MEFPGIALVTGAGSGIGRAVATKFAQVGCKKLALLDLNMSRLEETKRVIEQVKSIKDAAAFLKLYQCDISSEAEIEHTFARVALDFGRLDYVAHCAGILTVGSTADLASTDFDKTMSINLRGAFLCSKAAIRIMTNQSLDCEAYPHADIPEHRAQRGALVLIASALGSVTRPNATAYSASKAGVHSLVRSNALDYAGARIRSNAVLPGVIDTPMIGDQATRERLVTEVIGLHTPFKRFGQPEEVADAILFLASNKASYITGVGLPVDGGYMI